MSPSPVPALGINQLEQIMLRLISLIVPIAFIILTIVLLWAGITYLTSGGESKQIQKAGQIVTWALLGILFLALAWLILLLIKAFTGVDVTNFGIKYFCGPNNQWCP